MKRIFYICLCSLILFVSVSPLLSFGYYTTDPILVSSAIQEPVPEINIVGSNTTYIQYYVLQNYSSSVPVNYLYKIIFTVPSSADVIFRLDHKQFVCINSTASAGIAYHVDRYDVVTGQFLEKYDFISSSESFLLLSGYTSVFKFRSGYFPIESANVNQDFFGYPITNISVSSSSQGSTSHQYWNTNSNPFVQWLEPSNDAVVRSRIPQPLSDLHHMYFADDLHLYQLNIDFPTFYQSVGLQANSLTASEFFDQCYVELKKRDATHVTITIKNRSEHSFNAYLSSYDVVTGEYIQTTSLSVAGVTSSSGDEVVVDYSVSLDDPIHKGIWYTGFLNTDGLLDFDKLRISWSDTIDYSSDFQSINSLLGFIESDLLNISATVSNLDTFLRQVKASIDSIYSLLNTNFLWFKNTYFNTIINKWDITKVQLDSIIQLLQGNSETTYPVDSSVSDSVEDYVSQENELFTNFDQAGDQADVVFDEAISQFSANSNGFSFIRMILETFVFSIPSSYIIVFVSLTFGLVIMIIGRVIGGSKS